MYWSMCVRVETYVILTWVVELHWGSSMFMFGIHARWIVGLRPENI